jgi:hypothetical protein
MTLRGRHWILLWLVVFLGTAVAIATRQSQALGTARRLRVLQDRRTGLEARRTELLRRIDEATSREVLVPRMERAGFHLPRDSENILIRLDTLRATAAKAP